MQVRCTIFHLFHIYIFSLYYQCTGSVFPNVYLCIYYIFGSKKRLIQTYITDHGRMQNFCMDKIRAKLVH